jgi:hypothetical protein
MEKFKVKLIQNGPIKTVHIIDGKEQLDVAIGEDLEDTIAKAVAITNV